jgi:hypothetical protein
MATSFTMRQTDDCVARFINDYLCFESVALFLAGVAGPLLFWGRSIGVSVASISTTSNCISLLSSAFLPGSVKAPLLISVSSHHLIVRKAVLSLTPKLPPEQRTSRYMSTS